MAEDRLAKMREIAGRAQAEKEKKALEDAERVKRETESKGAERVQVDSELAGASQKLVELDSQLGEAENLAGQMAELPDDARAEFDVELKALRAEATTLRESIKDLNVRKQKLDAELVPATQTEVKEEEPRTREQIFEESKAEILASAQAEIDAAKDIPEEWKDSLKERLRATVDTYKFQEGHVQRKLEKIPSSDFEEIIDPETQKLREQAAKIYDNPPSNSGSEWGSERIKKTQEDLKDYNRRSNDATTLYLDRKSLIAQNPLFKSADKIFSLIHNREKEEMREAARVAETKD